MGKEETEVDRQWEMWKIQHLSHISCTWTFSFHARKRLLHSMACEKSWKIHTDSFISFGCSMCLHAILHVHYVDLNFNLYLFQPSSLSAPPVTIPCPLTTASLPLLATRPRCWQSVKCWNARCQREPSAPLFTNISSTFRSFWSC